MKATHTKTPPTFTPVTINITCETQEELDALTCLFNYGHVNRALERNFSGFVGRIVREVLETAGGTYGKHRKFYTDLEDDIKCSNSW